MKRDRTARGNKAEAVTQPSTAGDDQPREMVTTNEVTLDSERDAEVLDELTRQQVKSLQQWLYDYSRTHAAETNRALLGDWRHFARWCAELNLVPATVTVGTVASYIASLESLAVGTIRRRGASLLKLFKALDFFEADMVEMRRVINVETRALVREKAEREETEITPAQPLRWSTIQKAIARMDDTDMLHVRNRAMVRLAYDGMLRRSELVRARVRHLKSLTRGKALGQDDALLRLPRSKTDQEGKGARVWCRRETAGLVADWIRRAQLQPDDYLFPSFQGRGRSINRDGPMGAGTVNDLFRWVVEKAGEESSGITGHSCRRGAAHDMLDKGIPPAEIVVAGRWKNAEMLFRYLEGMDLKDGAVAALAEQQREAEEEQDRGSWK